ncbi:hypothetical protein HNR46_001035 [Haloferula luteola]|uniref:Class I SAM-dependent methyltransferase n=1 Tax=Haloferula luteola TaxID=595692 RepID=A0A840VD73_9BACT|nr:hypothetical protein [Haloferula luteola]MBB5350801.1 hypothetical protein [Haloferula luteola]
MTEKEIERLHFALSKSKVYLEYGSGNSTRLAAGHDNIQVIRSVESDRGFAESVLFVDSTIQKSLADGRLRFLFPNIGPTKEWGYPVNDRDQHLWPVYALCPYEISFKPDLILIDGRFRVACSILAALHHPKATVLVHDYHRPNYQIMEQFLHLEERIDNLAILSQKSNFSRNEAIRLLDFYLHSPEDLSQSLCGRIRRKIGNAVRKTDHH